MTDTARHLVLDTSCIVSLLCPWHEQHERTHASVSRLVKAGATLGVVSHALIESYAVLTRLPPPYRLPGSAADDLLRRNFASAEIVSLGARDYWSLIHEARAKGVTGGRVYDALIAKSAARFSRCTLLTLNIKHFADLERPGLTLASP